MAEELFTTKFFALLFWYYKERHWTIQSTSTIVRPRKEPNAYETGDLVFAKYQGKPYKAAVIGVEASKEELKERQLQLGNLITKKNADTKAILKEFQGFTEENLKDLDDGLNLPGIEMPAAVEPGDARAGTSTDLLAMDLPPLQHTKKVTKRQNKRQANDTHMEKDTGDDQKKKKKLQKDAALNEINQLILDLQVPNENLNDDSQTQNQQLSSVLEASHEVLFDFPMMDCQTETRPSDSSCCPHCTNLHVRLDKLEEEFKHLKTEFIRQQQQQQQQLHQQQQQYLYQQQHQLQQQQFQQQQQQHQQEQQHQQQQQHQQHQQQQTHEIPQQHQQQFSQLQTQQESSTEQLFNGFTKEQLLAKIRHLPFSRACKVLCRIIFKEEERNGHSVTGLGGKPGLDKERLEALYGIIQQQFPQGSSTQAINIKLAEVLKPSATKK